MAQGGGEAAKAGTEHLWRVAGLRPYKEKPLHPYLARGRVFPRLGLGLDGLELRADAVLAWAPRALREGRTAEGTAPE